MARYPLAIWTPLPGIGSYSEGPFKVVHHTTQGSTAAGAIATYRDTGNYPHFTVAGDVVYQHVDTNIAVTALEHPSGTVETNRSHAIQIELVGFAERSKSATSLASMAALCRWLEEQHNIPPVWPNGLPYPPVNGHEPHVPFNRSETNWRNKGGHYGHCHVPNNHHWDPGYTADEVALVMGSAAAHGLAAALQAREPDSMPAMTAFGASASAQSAQLTPYVDSLVKIAKGEYQAFHTIVETDEPLRSRIDVYCRGIGIAAPANISKFAWSATFVSWCIKKAGATSREFTFSPTHAVFVRAAIANADAQIGVFRARPIASYAPQVGDLIHRNRSGGTITYAEARTNSEYPSHSAIVVEVGEDQAGRYAMTVGGNEHDSIRMTRVALNGAGMVAQKAGNPFICVVQDLKIDAEPQAVERTDASAAAASRRLEMAKIIVDFEARRDAQGRLVVYQLPPDDGGGRYEVAGINERYNKTLCDELVQLVQSGRQQEAEARAVAFIADDTEQAARWTSNGAIEFYLRDCVFNRGPRGAAWIVQTAVGVAVDQSVGPLTLAAIARDETRPLDLLSRLRQAREAYERLRRDETSRFWKGLVNRWNKALTSAKTFLADGTDAAGAAADIEPRPAPAADVPSPPSGDDQSWAERPPMPGAGSGADAGPAAAPAQAAAYEFDAPDPRAIRGGASAVFKPQVAAAAALRRQSPSAANIVEMHRALEARLFAPKSASAAAAAASDDPPGPQDMIVGVGIGAAHRDFESIGPAGPGAPVLNVYVKEKMGMEAVKRVLVDHYGLGDLASDRHPVNVHHTGPIFAASQMHRERPSPCGISVGHYLITAGTQGVLARGIAGSDRARRLLMLSNNHVLANVNDCKAGDPIHQPGPLDLKTLGLTPSAATQIGILEQWVPLDFSGDNYVDCATAWCVPGNADAANVVRKDFIQQKAGQWSYFNVSSAPIVATKDLLVGKSGRTSQLTSGRIDDANVSISVSYENGKVANFKDQFSVVGNDGRAFGAGGDSGALVWTWNDDRSPVGLLFAVGRDYTFVNKIDHVLQALQIELYT
jgi:lysozyme family protein